MHTPNGPQGTTPGSPTGCASETGGFLNTHPQTFNYEFGFAFTYTVSGTRPVYINSDYRHGVVDAHISLRNYDIDGEGKHVYEVLG